MPHYQDLTHAVTSLPFSERMHVLEALDASLKADHADSGSFSAEQQSILSRRSATPAEQYVPWEQARDAMLLRIINAP